MISKNNHWTFCVLVFCGVQILAPTILEQYNSSDFKHNYELTFIREKFFSGQKLGGDTKNL